MLELRLALRLLSDLKRFGDIRQKLVAPVGKLRLADVVALADGPHRFSLEPLKHNKGLGPGIPLPSLHG